MYIVKVNGVQVEELEDYAQAEDFAAAMESFAAYWLAQEKITTTIEET